MEPLGGSAALEAMVAELAVLLMPTALPAPNLDGGEEGNVPPDKEAVASEVSLYLLYGFYTCTRIQYVYRC